MNVAKFQIWSSRHLFTDADSAETFLGVLDTVFLVAYAVVKKNVLVAC